jgi:DNA-binding MarR family transcriptional regulator
MTGLSTGAITGVVDRLEKAGIVSRERDREDRRVVFIHPEVKKIESEINPIFVQLGQEFYDILSNYNDKELAIIADYMTKSIKTSERITENLRDKVNLAKQKSESQSHN